MINKKAPHSAYSDYSKVDVTYNTFRNGEQSSEALRKWEEKLGGIIAKLPVKEDKLKPLIQFLVITICPAKIYKIDYYSAAAAEKQLYTDLLLVVPGKDNRSFKELEAILKIPYLPSNTIRCSLHNEGQLINLLEIGHIFFSKHCIPQNLIYDHDNLNYPVTPSAVLASLNQKALNKLDLSFQKAFDFLSTASYWINKAVEGASAPSELIGFFLHQSVELTYRSILKHLFGYDKKTHEIRLLMAHVSRFAPQLAVFFPDETSEDVRLLDLLESAYLKSRYELEYPVSQRDLSVLLDKATALQKVAINLVAVNLKE